MIEFLLFVIAAVAAFLYFLPDQIYNLINKSREARLARETDGRYGLIAFFQKHLAEIQAANLKFQVHDQTFASGYFTNYSLQSWIDEFRSLYETIRNTRYETIGLATAEVTTIRQFLDYFINGHHYKTEYNKAFIQQELINYGAFFDNVEKRKLDLQQRTAIVTDEDNNLVIAGAGSGKTTTIVGKVGYIIDRYKVPADEILLISFTNKSAATLAGRINIPGVEAKTFHKFGIDVIAATEQKQPSIFDEVQFKRLITGLFTELVRNQVYLAKVTFYFTNFLKPPKSQDEFKNQGEYFQYLKDQNFSTYKAIEVPVKDRTTFKREVVKSIEECKIANFLLFNGIEYEYELPYPHQTATSTHRQYKPDFTLGPKTKPVYLEHFALNKIGMVPPFFADTKKGQTPEQATKEYKDGIQWKRELHSNYGTSMIETYSHEMFDDTLFVKLKTKLEAAGIPLRPKTPEEIWAIISEAANDEVDSFISLFQTFITLLKSNNYTIDDLSRKNGSVKNNFHRERNALFLEIISPIFERYQDYLAQRKEIDFSDMVNKASHYIKTKAFDKQFSYVIIDEFQDISIGRYQLIAAIKASNPTCKLFCVGDDWQSIYRFSGSDIALFKDFEKHFGSTEQSMIETTYRFHNPLMDLSSQFILKNPSQSQKRLKSTSDSGSTSWEIVYSDSDNQDDSIAVKGIFDNLLTSGKTTGKEIYILSRYSYDLERLKLGPFDFDKGKETVTYMLKTTDGKTLRLSAKFMTIHKAKGLEADIVIVINCNSGKYGFPSGMSDDPALNLLLSEADQFENGEERRLFYVAMTRAKEQLYLVADSAGKSKFIAELELENRSSPVRKCPKCLTADLVKRSGVKNGKKWAFYGCSNFTYGCDYQEWITA